MLKRLNTVRACAVTMNGLGVIAVRLQCAKSMLYRM